MEFTLMKRNTIEIYVLPNNDVMNYLFFKYFSIAFL